MQEIGFIFFTSTSMTPPKDYEISLSRTIVNLSLQVILLKKNLDDEQSTFKLYPHIQEICMQLNLLSPNKIHLSFSGYVTEGSGVFLWSQTEET